MKWIGILIVSLVVGVAIAHHFKRPTVQPVVINAAQSYGNEMTAYKETVTADHGAADLRLRAAIAKMVENAEEITIDGFDPDGGTLVDDKYETVEHPGFIIVGGRSYKIRKQFTLPSAETAVLAHLLANAIQSNYEGPSPKCFMPAHGVEVRISNDLTLRFLICVRCGQVAFSDPVYTIGFWPFRDLPLQQYLLKVVPIGT